MFWRRKVYLILLTILKYKTRIFCLIIAVLISLDFSIEYDENVEFEDTEQISSKYIWNNASTEGFINQLQQPSITDLLAGLNNWLSW